VAIAPVFFAKPDAGMAVLEVAPRLASRMASGAAVGARQEPSAR
jgi:hypothetical protein